MTNRHVCDAQMKYYKLGNIQFGNYVGKIIAIDKKHDLCLVTSNRQDGLEIAKKPAKNMDKIYLVGFPRGIGKVIREGRIIEEKYFNVPWLDNNFVRSLQVSTLAYPGNSGSPVTNKFGKVIGVLYAGSPMYPNEPLIVPYEDMLDFLRRTVLGL